MANSVDLTDLKNTLGAYCRQNKREIYRKISVGITRQHFTNLGNQTDEVPLPRLRTGKLLKPSNPTAAFSGGADKLKLSARVLKIRKMSFDVQIYPQLLWDTWLGLMDARTPTDPLVPPFEEYFMTALTDQAAEDLEMDAIWTGVYNAAGSTPADTMDGLLTKVAAEIVTGEIPAGNIFAGAAITVNNAVAQLEGVKKKVAVQYRNKKLKLFCSVTVKDLFEENYRALYGALPYNTKFEKLVLDGTNIELCPIPGMKTSQRIIITTQENIVFADYPEGMINVQEFDRSLKILGDYRAGIEFCDGEIIWCNDLT